MVKLSQIQLFCTKNVEKAAFGVRHTQTLVQIYNKPFIRERSKFAKNTKIEWSYLKNHRNHHVRDFFEGWRETNFVDLQNQFHLNQRQLPSVRKDLHVTQNAPS